MSVDRPIRVLLADDQALVRAGFSSILSRLPDIEVTGEAGDGAEAVDLATRLRPDLVLMDIRMPRMDGLAATERLMASAHPPKIVVLTTFDGDEFVYGALRAGAVGFLLKDISPEQLVAAVRSAVSGDAMLSPSVTRLLIEAYVQSPAPVTGVPEQLTDLTEREVDVLREVARGRSNAEIGATLFLAETTIKTHLARIYTKLAVRDRVHAVVLAYESGLVRPGS
ncbi:response regulator transcription factor [Ornithinimicrobium sp. F0845]|uniref:response regulator n=1 Tax=Ornithinimicrobium sp. F0845 TaxID=2926412 RepID=UPI001FF3A896|nr:response regulator transcription factor [Ornithinimicrobium sp. F0845]